MGVQRKTVMNRRQFGMLSAAGLAAFSSGAHAQSRQIVVSTFGGDFAGVLRDDLGPLIAPGINVVQDVGGEPARVAKIMAQRRLPRGTADAVHLQAPGLFDLNHAGLLEELDESKVPNLVHLAPEVRTNYSVPTIISPYPIVYNSRLVAEPPKDFADLLSPRFANKVGVVSVAFIFPMLNASIHYTGSPSNIEEVKDVFKELSANGLKLYSGPEALGPALLSGEIEVALVPLARVVQWQGEGLPIESVFQSAGTVVYMASAGVLKNAPNDKEASYAYLNASLDPAVQLGFANKMGYMPTTTNSGLDPEQLARLGPPTSDTRLVVADFAYLQEIRASINEWWEREIVRT